MKKKNQQRMQFMHLDEISRIGKGAYKSRKNRNRLWKSMVEKQFKVDEEQFKGKFRIFKCNIDHIVSIIRPFIEKTPTNLVPDPIQREKQLALIIYRLAHGCSFAVISDLFG